MRNKEKIDKLSECALIRFSKKTGKIDTTLTGKGHAMLSLWGLQNTTSTKKTIVFDIKTGLIIARYAGNSKGLTSCEWGENDENIEKYAPGILETFN